MCNVISFATPLLFNVMIDKVVPHHSYQTLLAVSLAFAVMVLFDGVFGYVRQSLTLLASNKIDARLAGAYVRASAEPAAAILRNATRPACCCATCSRPRRSGIS